MKLGGHTGTALVPSADFNYGLVSGNRHSGRHGPSVPSQCAPNVVIALEQKLEKIS